MPKDAYVAGGSEVFRPKPGAGKKPCRQPTPAPSTARPLAPSANRSDCIHILEPTGHDASQAGCGGCGMKLTSIWGCGLHGDCAPFAKGKIVTAGVVKCRDCNDYVRKPIAPDADAAVK